MSKELDFLREDYQKAKNEVEANNKILEDLLREPLVRLYRDTYIKNEEKKKVLEVLGVSLTHQEMMECEHTFIRTEILAERDYDRVVREPIYHCLKCGLTNGYEVKGVNTLLLSKTENDMAYVFEQTAKKGIILHERRTCSLEVAKKIYEEIKKANPNITNKELKTLFIVALSKSDPTYYQDLTYEIRRLAGFEIKEDKDVLQRIELRQIDIPVIENGITCYEMSDFTKDLFDFIRIIKKRAEIEFTSLEDISKYPELVSEELEKLSEKEKQARFDVMAVPNPKAYVIASDKWQEFINSKPNPEIRKENAEMIQQFRMNNLVQAEETKKKTKIKN